MPAGVNGNVLIEDARVMFRNFEGNEKPFNSKGDRNFCIFLDPDMADSLRAEGWNIKSLKPKADAEEGEIPQQYVQVTVNYDKGRPPRVVLVTSGGQTELGAAEVAMLDVADVAKWEVVLNPYHWDIPGTGKGVKAYLKTAFVHLAEDELEQKYALMMSAKDEPYEDDEEAA